MVERWEKDKTKVKMNQKLKQLRDKCTDKQEKFVQLHKNGQDRGDAYINAGYKAKTKQQAQINASRLLTKNDKCIAYFEALKAHDDRNTNISRSMQLNRLNTLYDMAIVQKNVSAGASVIREQNEMLGYHRENAPNPEAAQERRALIEHELKELERLAALRTAELSQTARILDQNLIENAQYPAKSVESEVVSVDNSET